MQKNHNNAKISTSASESAENIGNRGTTSTNRDQNQSNTILIDNWSTIYDSKVLAKTKEGIPCGNVVAEYNDNIVLINFGASNSQEYLIPKSRIERYDGKCLYLTIAHEVLMLYGF
jgi:hypothetical protein